MGAVSRRRRVPDEPDKLWCLGRCQRALPPEAFPRNRHGNADSRCHACKRYRDRHAKRAVYQRSPSYRAKKLAKNRARYAAVREARRAYRRQYYSTHRSQALASDRRYRLAQAKKRSVAA